MTGRPISRPTAEHAIKTKPSICLLQGTEGISAWVNISSASANVNSPASAARNYCVTVGLVFWLP
jgi:hypothetical protein